MDSAHPEALVHSKVDTRWRLSPIWAIPIVTVLIAGFLVWHTYSQRGPTITIGFHSAEGLTAGQSQVRLREVTVGTVETIALNEDRTGVILTVRMTREAEPLLTTGARFWVVKPRLFAGAVSGVSTLLSGSYIQLSPEIGEPGARERNFTGLEDPPVVPSGEPGRTIRIEADRLGSISLGAPVFYRDFSVGQVLGWDIGNMAESVTLQVFIRSPFDQYLREGSRFWNASGVSLTLGAQGVQLQLESIRALLLGGIAFDTPEAARSGPAPTSEHAFRLFASEQAANNAAVQRRVRVVSYFNEAVGGLAVGAPVVFNGIRIGEVLGYDLQYDPESDRLRIPVRYEIEPGRISLSDQARTRGPLENARLLVRQGLRARLASANLLTGQQQISLDIIHNATPAEVTIQDGVIVLPSAPGQFAGIFDAVQGVLARIESIPFQQIGENVNGVLQRIEALPFQEIGANLNSALASVNTLVSGPELRASLNSLQTALADAQELIRHADQAIGPALSALPPLITNLQTTVSQANRMIGSVNRGYGDNSQFLRDLDRALEQITAAARSLRGLTDTLNRNPESLIRGRATQGSP